MTSRLYNLDAVRGICAILVVMMHTSLLIGWPLLPGGVICVDVFFVMSGFVIARSYERHLQKGEYFFTFLRRRLTRLMPLWCLGLAIGAAFPVAQATYHSRSPVPLLALIPQCFFIPIHQSDHLFTYNSPGWSLSCEMIVNLCYAACVPILSQTRLRWTVGIFAATLLVVAWYFKTLGAGFHWTDVEVGLARAAFGFFAGVWLHRKVQTDRPRSLPPLAFLLALAAILLLAIFPMSWLYNWVAIVTLIPAIVWLSVNARPVAPWLSERLGALSYPLYTTHLPILLGLITLRGLFTHRWNTDPFPLAIVCAAFAFAIGFAIFLGEMVDPAVQRWIAAKLGKRPVRVAPVDELFR